ncbi:hypothetical protein [Beijerinckia sp. L45]|uniref:hypothetical protein n=1 Tax=Beijerinckia sp. L45 TaxID=1641855 RepID=UPI00131C7935|nr:hypothetical protein [Beijerinckia sp. L45]
MINSVPPPTPDAASDDAAVDAIVRSGPSGAIVVAGIATAIVVALWFAFYLFVFLPRGAVQ